MSYYSYKKMVNDMIERDQHKYSFDFDQPYLPAVEYFSVILKHLKFSTLRLMDLSSKHLKLITKGLRGNKVVKKLIIQNCDMEDEGARYVARVLKHSAISILFICGSKIGDVAAKHLAEGLKDSRVDEIKFSTGSIGGDGLKSLADVWKEGKIRKLAINNNATTSITKALESIHEMLELADDRILRCCLKHPMGGLNYCIIRFCKSNSQYPCVTLSPSSISYAMENIIELMKKIFGHVNLQLNDFGDFEDDQISFLKEIINKTSIREVQIGFTETDISKLKDISYILQNRHINKLKLKMYPRIRLANILRSQINLCVTCNKKRAPLDNILESTRVRYLSLRIGPNLGHYYIKLLTLALKNSQVTHLELRNVLLDSKIANYFADIMEYTQLVSIKFLNHTLADSSTKRYLEGLAKNRKTAKQACTAFDNLVTVDLKNNLEFTLPKDRGSPNLYFDLINILCKNPNVSTHFKENRLEIEDKIDDFVAHIEDRFNVFINNNIVSLVHQYDDFNFIKLVKAFDSANLDQIVQNLLLHRDLFYVDYEDEILHPFIYKMLHKYELPLYNEQLEPNKKWEIINYYLKRTEMQDVEDLLELLGHKTPTDIR